MFEKSSIYLFCVLCVAVDIACAAGNAPPTITPDFYALNITGPPIITEGDNVTFKCSSKYFQSAEETFLWTHVTFENKMTVLSSNETLKIIIDYVPDSNEFEFYSKLTITNITKQFNGRINCSNVYWKQRFKKERKPVIWPVQVEQSQIPVIQNASSSNMTKITGQSTQWWCFVHGMPPPTVTWFKNGVPLILSKNDSRVVLKDDNQTLLIYSSGVEDIGTYECRASNRIGTAVSTNTLYITDEIRAEDKSSDTIVLSSVLTIFLVVSMMFFFVYFKRRWESKMNVFQADTLHVDSYLIKTWNPDSEFGEEAELLPHDERWEFPRDKLTLGKELGSGAFGVVFKAEAVDIIDKGTTSIVAVKMVKPDTDPLYTKALASELKIMMNVGQHLNVVNLLGSCTTGLGNKRLMVIVEYCQFGSIHQYLLNHRECYVNQVTNDGNLDYNIKTISKVPHYENVINNENHLYANSNETKLDAEDYLVPDNIGPMWRSNYCGDYKHVVTKPLCTLDLICWSYQVSKGMEYLASKKILHGDLAARNVLLSDRNIVKICDFGFAKTLYDSEIYKKKSKKDRLPVKWMAIECLRDLVFSTQSDIWAFGIVVWEIFSLAVTPYPHLRTFEELYNKLINGYRMERPNYANSKIYEIMLDCWESDPTLRPSFTDLAGRLGFLLQHSTQSKYVDLNEIYVRMISKKSPQNEYVYPILPISTDTDSNSCQVNESESSERTNDVRKGLALYNSSSI